MTWETVPLGDLYQRRGSIAPQSGEKYTLYSVPAYETGSPQIVDGHEIQSNKQYVHADDVLLCRIVPHIRRAWLVSTHTRTAIGSTEWIVLRHPAFDASFLRHYVLSDSFHSEFMATLAGVGGSLSRARPAAAARIRVPLPPLPEQRRIAAILDEADALRSAAASAEANTRAVPPSLFDALFSDGARFDHATLGQVTTKIGSGATPRGGREAYKGGPVALIRSMNVHDNQFKTRGLALISQEQANRLDNVTVEPLDVLLNITGASVARVCTAPADILPARVNQHVAIIRPMPSVDPVFLSFQLASSAAKRRLLMGATGAGATREAITKAALARFRVFVPPVEKQREFRASVASAEDLRANFNSAIAQLDALFTSLQYRAFRGEL